MSTTKRNVALVLGLVISVAAVGVYSLGEGSKSSAADNEVARSVNPVTPKPIARNLDTEVKLVTSVNLGIPRPGMAIEAGRTAIVITDNRIAVRFQYEYHDAERQLVPCLWK